MNNAAAQGAFGAHAQNNPAPNMPNINNQNTQDASSITKETQQNAGPQGTGLPSRKKISKSHNPSGRSSPTGALPAQLKADQQRESKAQQPPPAKKQAHKEGKNCIRKFAFATRVGFHPNNPNKVNQDAYILQPNIQGLPQVHLFGVCDGHGQFGRNVSSFVKVALA